MGDRHLKVVAGREVLHLGGILIEMKEANEAVSNYSWGPGRLLKQEALRREMLEDCEEGSAGWKPEGRDALEFFSVIAASAKKVLVV